MKKQNSIDITVFGYENKVKYAIYVPKIYFEDKHVDLLISEGEKKLYFLIQKLNTFIYDHTLHHGKKHFCCYCLQAFRTAGKLKCHIKDCFKINGKQTIKMSKKVKYIKFKNFRRKLPFMIYVDFESILVSEDNRKQYPNESSANKYQKHVTCSYGCKLVCVDDSSVIWSLLVKMGSGFFKFLAT